VLLLSDTFRRRSSRLFLEQAETSLDSERTRSGRANNEPSAFSLFSSGGGIAPASAVSVEVTLKARS